MLGRLIVVAALICWVFALAIIFLAGAQAADVQRVHPPGSEIVGKGGTIWPICEGPNRAERRLSCVVDGDTFWADGVKHRLACVDAHELDYVVPGYDSQSPLPRGRWAQTALRWALGRTKVEILVQRTPDGESAGEPAIDFFGRVLAGVDIDGEPYERVMVRDRLAVWTDFSGSRLFCQARRGAD